MRSYHLFLLSVLSGLLFSLAWPERGFPLLLFVAFIPLLIIENHFLNRKKETSVFSIIPYVLPAFFLWNLLTTWWIVHSTVVGAALAIVLNSIFMIFWFVLFHFTHRTFIKKSQSFLTLIFLWITFEFIHHHWDLNWPWLSLGNGFSAYPKLIQWYEFTGVFGGSLWILIINIMLFNTGSHLVKNYSVRRLIIEISKVSLVILIPVIISLIIYYNYDSDNGQAVDVVVVQPNIDPYTEQYELDPLYVVDRNWDLALRKLDRNVDFIVCPESAIQEYIWEHKIEYSESIRQFKKYLQDFPEAGIVIGLSSRKVYGEGEIPSLTSRQFADGAFYYDAYNTAVLIDTSNVLQLYHKSKLTPGVEQMPLTRYLKFIEKLAIDLGGTVGSLGVDAERTPFVTNKGLKIATAICYESVYGEFISGFIRNGAQIIFVITNDGWWENSPGHRQHLLFSSVRAVETRRYIARSANTGISCFINKRGDIIQPTAYWEPAVIRQVIYTGEGETFYVRYGDYIARISAFGSTIMLLSALVLVFKNRSKLII
ncbi:MAG: apolipoprotein N-acyltransferase [Bacteroidales bacterium]